MDIKPTRHRLWPPRFGIKVLMLLVFGAALVLRYAQWEYHQFLRRNSVSVNELVAHYNEVVAKPSKGEIPYLTNDEVIIALRGKSKHGNLNWLPLRSHIFVGRDDVGMSSTILLDGRHHPDKRTRTDMPPVPPMTYVLLSVYDGVLDQSSGYLLQSYSAIPMNITNLPPQLPRDAQRVRWLLLYGIVLASLAVCLTVIFRRAAFKSRKSQVVVVGKNRPCVVK